MRKPIFARYLSDISGQPSSTSPPYVNGANINWGSGGTVYRSQWAKYGAYNNVGRPVFPGIRRATSKFKAGSYISIDIERYGYNTIPVMDFHIDFIIQCKKARPDCFFGYYSTYCKNSNMVTLPPNSESRARVEKNNHSLQELSRFDDFAAPQLYPAYAGDVPTSGQGSWLSKYYSKYGFQEWAEAADWFITESHKYNEKVYPYFCPYTLQNGPDGNYGLGHLQYFCPWFADGVAFILDHPLTSGMFFFDLHNNSTPTWDVPTKNWIVEVLEGYTRKENEEQGSD